MQRLVSSASAPILFVMPWSQQTRTNSQEKTRLRDLIRSKACPLPIHYPVEPSPLSHWAKSTVSFQANYTVPSSQVHCPVETSPLSRAKFIVLLSQVQCHFEPSSMSLWAKSNVILSQIHRQPTVNVTVIIINIVLPSILVFYKLQWSAPSYSGVPQLHHQTPSDSIRIHQPQSASVIIIKITINTIININIIINTINLVLQSILCLLYHTDCSTKFLTTHRFFGGDDLSCTPLKLTGSSFWAGFHRLCTSEPQTVWVFDHIAAASFIAASIDSVLIWSH